MEFKVRDWMVNVIVFVDPDSTVSEALSAMRRRYIQSVIVNRSEDSPELGIITSTDVSDKIIAEGKNPSKVKSREIMTSPLIIVKQDMPLEDCSRVMHKHHIHHLPVVDEKGEVVGMISASDFLVAAEAMGREPGERLH